MSHSRTRMFTMMPSTRQLAFTIVSALAISVAASAQTPRVNDHGATACGERVVEANSLLSLPLSESAPGAASSATLAAATEPVHLRLAQVPAAMPPSSQIVIPAAALPQYGRVKRTGFRGFFGRLFGPPLSPVVRQLNNASWGLYDTASGLRSIEGPLSSLSAPLTELSQPVSNLAQPIGNLAQPISGLAQPISNLSAPINQLSPPVKELSRAADKLSQPVHGLGLSVGQLRAPLNGMQKPLAALPEQLNRLAEPLHDLQEPLVGLQRPLTGLAQPLDRLQQELHDLRVQMVRLEQTVLDIGRNVTLAIMFGSSVIAYAIWTQRKVPAAIEPTATRSERLAVDGSDTQISVIDNRMNS